MNQPSCQPFSDRQPIIHPPPLLPSLLCYRRGAYYDRWIKCTIAAPVSVPSGGWRGGWREGGLLSTALIEFGVARFRMTNARNHSRKCCIKGDINYSIYTTLSLVFVLGLSIVILGLYYILFFYSSPFSSSSFESGREDPFEMIVGSCLRFIYFFFFGSFVPTKFCAGKNAQVL